MSKTFGHDSHADQKYRSALRQYYLDKHREMINVSSLNDKHLEKSIISSLKDLDILYFSHLTRFNHTLKSLKLLMSPDRKNTIVSCHKLRYKKSTAVYGFIYYEYVKNVLVPKYVCTGPTFRSQDGEFRMRLIPFIQFDSFFQDNKDVEVVLRNILANRAYHEKNVYTYVYAPDDLRERARNDINSLNEEMELFDRLFMVSWFIDFYKIHNRLSENHSLPDYQYIIYQTDEIKYYDEIMGIIGREKYAALIMNFTLVHPTWPVTSSAAQIRCGQKIIPLTKGEVMMPGNIKHNIWREIYVDILCSNLTLNFISPSFPFLIDWFYINESDIHLFDNKAMQDKFTHSIISSKISDIMREADLHTYINDVKNNGYINNKFSYLSKQIRDGIIYSESNIGLSRTSICLVFEILGRTIKDAPPMAGNKESMYHVEFFTDRKLFSKHAFEFIYAIFCMTSKLKIIHGDLHTNNVTIFSHREIVDSIMRPSVNSPTVLYIIDKKIYGFPHYGYYSALIDFSRAIITDDAKINADFGRLFAETYFSDQKIKLLRILYNYAPKIVKKNYTKLELLMETNPDLAFKVISVLDIYVLFTNIKTMVEIDDVFTQGVIIVEPGIKKLLENIVSQSRNLLLEGLQSLINGSLKSVDDIDWPAKVLINEIFKEYLFSSTKIVDATINVIDVFNYNNELKYDISDYHHWGPIMNVDDVSLNKHKKTDADKNIYDNIKPLHVEEIPELIDESAEWMTM